MVTWQTLLAIDRAGLFPCLEHLHLAHNQLAEGIPEMDICAEQQRPFRHLRSLVLDGNGIVDWHVLRRAIDTFPGIESLHLNSNLLGETLDGLAEMALDMSPRRLIALFLNENRLSSWRAIGALSAYALLELRAQRVPLTEGDKPLASTMLLRQVLIALMPTLLRLNASEITVKGFV